MVAALMDGIARIEQQPTLPLPRSFGVTGIALVDQDGPDALLEEFIAGGIRRGGMAHPRSGTERGNGQQDGKEARLHGDRAGPGFCNHRRAPLLRGYALGVGFLI